MGYIGARNVAELKIEGLFIKVPAVDLRESHLHDVIKRWLIGNS
jgi:hypothetical protein